ncbi:MAG: hypothetical protein CM1200mP29_14500 [Verrucomicrobiota bacterium]|nr:MAG: hypothetical protein CM1200mP29_14500 [Verrucomicrobiota bacterium]
MEQDSRYPKANYDFAANPDLDESKEFPGTFLTCTTLKDPSKRAHGHHTMEAFSFVSWEAFRQWEKGPQRGPGSEEYKKFKRNLIPACLKRWRRPFPGFGTPRFSQNLAHPCPIVIMLPRLPAIFTGQKKPGAMLGRLRGQ